MTRVHPSKTLRQSTGSAVPADLRLRLETTRLDLRALFRALDQLHMAQQIPRLLHALFELDADLAEALWVLDQPPGRFDWAAMTRDTLASLQRIPAIRQAFLELVEEPARRSLEERTAVVRQMLNVQDAYQDIPGRDPQASMSRLTE